MKILITGFPGTGKTSITRELKKRGYIAYDPQAMQTYMHLEDSVTGQHIKLPESISRGWFDTKAAYNWDINRVSHLINSHQDLFICSLADNMDMLFSKFDKIFVLTLDDFTLEQRLQARNTTVSNMPTQLADILMLHSHFEEKLINTGAIPIDVKPAVKEVVDQILKLSFKN